MLKAHGQKYISRIICYVVLRQRCRCARLIKADDFELGSICPHENSVNPVLSSLGACNCSNTEAPLIRIRDISYDQRNSISRTSPRRTKWSFANPPQLLIAATNITGHKWLHPQTQIWLIKHRLRLSVLFTLVYHSGINTHLWKCDPSTVMHFIMIYARAIHGKCGSYEPHQTTIQCRSLTRHFPSLVFATLTEKSPLLKCTFMYVAGVTKPWFCVYGNTRVACTIARSSPPSQINYKVWSK